MAENNAIERLQRLAQAADSVALKEAQPVKKSHVTTKPYLTGKHGSRNGRNAILVLAAVMAVLTWWTSNSVHDSLPTNAKHFHHWTDVTSHFHAHPHAAASKNPQAYTSKTSGKGPAGSVEGQVRQQAAVPLRGGGGDRAGPPVAQPGGDRSPAAAGVVPRQQPRLAAARAQSPPPPVPQMQADAVPDEEDVDDEEVEEEMEAHMPPRVVPRVQQQSQPAPQQKAAGDSQQGGGSCNGDKCGPHGGCVNGACVCSVTYTGPLCDQPVEFPAALRAEAGVMSNWSAAFEGDMILNQKKMATRSALTVHLPGKEDEADHGFRTLISKPADMAQLNAMLPKEDTILTGAFYQSCAVVGSSGIVLNYEHGEEINAHDMVFRFNSAPTKGFERHVGAKTTHRITNTQNWGFHEHDDENLLIHFRAQSAIKGLFWNQKQRKKLRIAAFDPDFVEYMAFSLDFLATSGLYGIILAMQRCARVDLYGFQVSTAHGALYHYYDVCDVPANVGRDDSEYNVVRAFAKAGMVNFREPCIIECHNSPTECADCKELSGFKVVKLPSDAKCAPGRVSRGHLEVPWRRDRHRHSGHGHAR